MKEPHRIMMEIIVDIDSEIHEQAAGMMLRSLQAAINQAILNWEKPSFISSEEIVIRTTGWC